MLVGLEKELEAKSGEQRLSAVPFFPDWKVEQVGAAGIGPQFVQVLGPLHV